MYPIGFNGASQAILDTESMVHALVKEPDIPAALARYEGERREATAKIVLANRGNGPDQVMQLAEERAPEGFSHVNDVIPLVVLEEISAATSRPLGLPVRRSTRASICATESEIVSRCGHIGRPLFTRSR